MISRNIHSALFFSEGKLHKNFSSFITKLASKGHSTKLVEILLDDIVSGYTTYKTLDNSNDSYLK